MEATCCLCVRFYMIQKFNWQYDAFVNIPDYALLSFLAGQQPRAGEASALLDVQTEHPKADPDLFNSFT